VVEVEVVVDVVDSVDAAAAVVSNIVALVKPPRVALLVCDGDCWDEEDSTAIPERGVIKYKIQWYQW
jgi:hypothetical protein